MIQNSILKRCPEDGQECMLDACACPACFGVLRLWCSRCQDWLRATDCVICGTKLDVEVLPHAWHLNDQLIISVRRIRDLIVRHYTPANIKVLLGESVYGFIGTSSGANMTTFTVTADCMRATLDASIADGSIAIEEVQLIYPFLKTAAAFYANFRSDYRRFADFATIDTSQFLRFYQSDTGPFGYGNEATSWSGLSLCTNVASDCNDGRPLTLYEQLIVGLVTQIIAQGGVTHTESKLLREMKHRIRSAKAAINDDC
jgi:hypothetical protein